MIKETNDIVEADKLFKETNQHPVCERRDPLNPQVVTYIFQFPDVEIIKEPEIIEEKRSVGRPRSK